RFPDWNELAMPVRMDVFDRAESIRLLARKPSKLTEDDASRIADAVGDLPMALAQAVGRLRDPGVTAQDYLWALKNRPTVVLDQGIPGTRSKSLTRRLKEQFDQLIDDDRAAWEVLQLIGRLALGSLPFTLFTRDVSLLRAALEVDIGAPGVF